MSVEMTRFERLKEEYESFSDLGEMCHVTGQFCSRDRRLTVTRRISIQAL